MTARPFPDWHNIYRDQAAQSMPWYYPELDPDLERALDARPTANGRALDLGTGPATQAYALAARGFDVTASDLSEHAVEQGREGAKARGLRVTFVQDDIMNSQLPSGFDLIFDRGCFHVFEPASRARYVEAVARLLAPEGVFFLKCFSEEQPGEIGPYQSSPEQIREVFAARFDVLEIERTVYQGTLAVLPRALFCTLRLKRSGASASGR